MIYDLTLSHYSLQMQIFIKQTQRFALQKPLRNYARIYPTYNDTILIIEQLNLGKPFFYTENFKHLDKEGNLLFQHKMQMGNEKRENLASIMLNSRELVVPNIKDNLINIFNLEEKTVKIIAHKFLAWSYIKFVVYYFRETNLLCLVELANYQSQLKIMVTYYNVISGMMAKQYLIREKYDFGRSFDIFRANFNSMVVLAKYELDKLKFLKIFKKDVQTTFHFVRKIPGHILLGVWEHLPNQIELTLQSADKSHKAQSYILSLDKLILSKKCQTSSQVKLYHSLDNFQNHSLSIVKQKQQFTCIITNRLNDSFYQFQPQTPCLQWQKRAYVLQYDDKLVVESIKEQTVILQTASIYFIDNLMEVYLHFMLHLNKNFDDDLLFDAIEMLERGAQND